MSRDSLGWGNVSIALAPAEVQEAAGAVNRHAWSGLARGADADRVRNALTAPDSMGVVITGDRGVGKSLVGRSALAGFGSDDLTIEAKKNTLTIRGEKQSGKEETTYLHRGIASRSFERRFQLADHVVVNGAKLENGLLHVDLVRELPEAMKPRTIPIATKTDKTETPKVIDSKAA